MGRRSSLLLLALPVLLVLLQPAAPAGPPGGVAPSAGPNPPAAAGALTATLDEVSARVQLLRQEAEAAAVEAVVLRRELAAAETRIKGLEAARAEAGAALARLRAELVRSQAEARSLREEREAGPAPTDEGLNAVLATTTGPGAAAGGGGEADRRDAAGADSSAAPPAAPEIGPSRAHPALAVAWPDESGEPAERGTGTGEEPAAEQAEEAPAARADPGQPAPARPEPLPAAPQGSNARPWTGAKQGDGRPAIADRRAGALRAALAAVKRRIEEAEAIGTRHEATVAEPRTGLDSARAEVPPPDERLSAAPAPAATGRGPIEGGREAGPHGAAAGAESNPAPPAPVGGTARDAPAGDGSDGARAGEAEYLAASTPVNLRARPTMSAEVLAVVEEGGVVRRLGRGGGWLRVAYTDRFAVARTGWVHGSFLRSVDAPPRGDGAPARTEG